MKAKVHKSPDRVGGVPMAPLSSVNSITQLSGPDTTKAEPSESNKLIFFGQRDREVELVARVMLSSANSVMDEGGDLVSGAAVERKRTGHSIIADHGMGSVYVLQSEVSEHYTMPRKPDRMFGHLVTRAGRLEYEQKSQWRHASRRTVYCQIFLDGLARREPGARSERFH